MIKFYSIQPVPAPRQVPRDKFNPSPAVKRYRAFRDEVKWRGVKVPQPFYHVIFLLKIPKSWSNIKKAASYLQPHEQTPDRDNLEKALLDSVFGDDSHIHDGRTTKRWCDYPGFIISDDNMPVDPGELHKLIQEIKP